MGLFSKLFGSSTDIEKQLEELYIPIFQKTMGMSLGQAKKYFKDMVFTTVIKETVKFKESSVGGYSILEYAGSSDAAEAYRKLAREVMGGG